MRFAYWTILIGDSPTAFRAKEAAELQPTLVQLRRQHPDAVMKWFQRGRLWSSPAEAADAFSRKRSEERRDRDWRPGGTHEDKRLAYKRAKQAKWKAFHDRRRPVVKGDRGDAAPAAASGREDRGRQDWRSRPREDWRDKPREDKPRAEWRAKPREDRRDQPREDWRKAPRRDWREGSPGPEAKTGRDDVVRDERPAATEPIESRKRPREERSWSATPEGTRRERPFGSKTAGRPGRKPWGAKPAAGGGAAAGGSGGRKFGAKPFGKPGGGGRTFGDKPFGTPGEGKKFSGKPFGKPGGGGRKYGDKPFGKPSGGKKFSKPFGKPAGATRSDSKPFGEERGSKPPSRKPFGAKSFGAKPFGKKPFGKNSFGGKKPRPGSKPGGRPYRGAKSDDRFEKKKRPED